MKSITHNKQFALSLLGALSILIALPAAAHGPIGDHVNNLSDNVKKYTEEVNWLVGKIDGIVSRYETKGAKAARAETVSDHWEAVDFHAAIETSFIPVYASIWQGLYAVKESIDNGASVANVRKEQRKLEQTLWQALGAVRLAASYQERGLLDKIQTSEGGATDSIGTLGEIKTRLDRVVAKYAEKLADESVTIVHDTYLNLFEGVEGELIGQDANLVEDLEKDFNVTLPKAIQGGASVDKVRQVVTAMHDKLDLAKSLLEKANKGKKDVF